MTATIVEVIQLSVGAIAGVRVSMKMDRDGLTFFDQKTRVAAFELLLTELAFAVTVLLMVLD